MTPTSSPLQALRSLHLPHAISSWPPAPGWTVLATLILVCGLGVAFWKYRQAKQRRIQVAALSLLAKIEQHYQSQRDVCATVSELSILLRRVALAYFRRRDIAGLQGVAWLKFLDTSGQTTAFTRGIGKQLICAPYQQQPKVNMSQLFRIIRYWIMQRQQQAIQKVKQRSRWRKFLNLETFKLLIWK